MKKTVKNGGASLEGQYFGNVSATELTTIKPFFHHYGKTYPEFNYDSALNSYNIVTYGGSNKRNGKLYKDTKTLMKNMLANYKEGNRKSILYKTKKYINGGADPLESNFPISGKELKDISELNISKQYSYPSFDRMKEVSQSPFSSLWVKD